MDRVDDDTVQALIDLAKFRFRSETVRQSFMVTPSAILGHRSPREVLRRRDHFEMMQLSLLLMLANPGVARGTSCRPAMLVTDIPRLH